jgi:hypothetical protein
MGKWKYVSNPYFINSEFLEEAIKTMKEHGVRFDITGESNYFPGRTFQIRKVKMTGNISHRHQKTEAGHEPLLKANPELRHSCDRFNPTLVSF